MVTTFDAVTFNVLAKACAQDMVFVMRDFPLGTRFHVIKVKSSGHVAIFYSFLLLLFRVDCQFL